MQFGAELIFRQDSGAKAKFSNAPELKTPIPGPRSRDLAQELRAHESRNVTYISPRFPVFWQRAEGANVWDVDGNRFLDLTSGFGVASLGFTPAPIVAAATEQLRRLYHAMGDVHPTEEKVELCRRLAELTFESWRMGRAKTILTNSGSEAVEAALKTAWLATRRRGVLAFTGGYHGLGYGALTVTGRDYFRSPFADQLADFATFLPYPDAAAEPIDEKDFLRAAEPIFEKGQIGAILVEPIQGRGGQIVPPDWFLPSLRDLADRHDAILIFDEIFTGFYRTGKRFARDHWTARPDVVCLGKALTSGFPLAACVGRVQVMDDAWPETTGEALYTSTFLGNPLGCRMALESLKLLESAPWAERVTALGQHLNQALQKLKESAPGWGRIRGRGLMQGIEVLDRAGQPDPARAGKMIEQALARGLIVLSGGVDQNILSFTPPFVISAEEIYFALEVLGELGAAG